MSVNGGGSRFDPYRSFALQFVRAYNYTKGIIVGAGVRSMADWVTFEQNGEDLLSHVTESVSSESRDRRR